MSRGKARRVSSKIRDTAAEAAVKTALLRKSREDRLIDRLEVAMPASGGMITGVTKVKGVISGTIVGDGWTRQFRALDADDLEVDVMPKVMT